MRKTNAGPRRAYTWTLLFFLLVISSSPPSAQEKSDLSINNNMTLEQIAKTVRAALPTGTSLAEAEEYFTSNHVEHGLYNQNSQILAMIHNIRGGRFLISKDAQIIIKFDATGKLTNIEANPVFTGP